MSLYYFISSVDFLFLSSKESINNINVDGEEPAILLMDAASRVCSSRFLPQLMMELDALVCVE